MSHNISKSKDKFNLSAAETLGFLQELVELAGQDGLSASTPVLELQFNEVLTKTWLSTGEKQHYLSVTAFLPRMAQSSRRGATLPLDMLRSKGLLWDSDEGRYVIVREVPVSDLSDEVSVMDAILSASDQARELIGLLKYQRPWIF